METILVLTDFSDAAFHAACYAGGLTLQLHTKKLVLYHAYDIPFPVPDSSKLVDELTDTMQQESMESLGVLSGQLAKFVNPQTTVHCLAGAGNLAQLINELATEYNAGLVVMGITGKSALEQQLVGSHTTRVAEVCKAPLLIVPQQAAIAPVEKIVFACDMRSVPETIPGILLNKVLGEFKAPLMVVTVEHAEGVSSPEAITTETTLYGLLEQHKATFHTVNKTDIIEGIMEFSITNNASLIIAVPKQRGFFEGLFHRSVTKKLAFHSSIPLLVLNENAKATAAEPF